MSSFAASPAQRKKVRFEQCVVCEFPECDPAHTVSKAMGGDDDPRAVVPLCRECHRAYDTGTLSLLEHLEPSHREELAYAVQQVGMVTALQLLTNRRWEPGR
jgi:hypothetical protein